MGSNEQIQELKSDARYIEPSSCHARWHFDEYSRIRCGGPNHLAIHDIMSFTEGEEEGEEEGCENNFIKKADKYELTIKLPLHNIVDIAELQNELLSNIKILANRY